MSSFRISDILSTPYSPPSPVTPSMTAEVTPSVSLASLFTSNSLLTPHDSSLDDDSLLLPSSPSSLQSSSFDSSGTGESTGAVESVEPSKENTVVVREGDDYKRPQLSYNALIMMAIRDSPEGKLSLSGIYEYILANYAFYRHSKDNNWKNSIRHNLSLCKSFVRVPREFGDPGKGSYWTIAKSVDEELTLHTSTGKLRRRRTQSVIPPVGYGIYGPSPFSSALPSFPLLPLMQLQPLDPRMLTGLLR